MTAPSWEWLSLLAGLPWALEGTEPACDFRLGLSQSPEPYLPPREPGSRTAAPRSLVLRVPPPCPALCTSQAMGMRFLVPGFRSHCCSEMGRGDILESLRCPVASPPRAVSVMTREQQWRRGTPGSALSRGGAFGGWVVAHDLTELYYKEGTLPNKDLTQSPG